MTANQADRSFLPELRRRRYVASEQLREALHQLHQAQARYNELQALMAELERLIAENDFYHPPPRPAV